MADIFGALDYSEAHELSVKLSHAGTKFYRQAATIMDIAYHHTPALSDANRDLQAAADRHSDCMAEMHALAEDLAPVISAALDRYLARSGA